MKLVNGKVMVLQKNGSIIPYMDGEEVLFWWRVKRLQKMIRIEKWRKRFTEMHMWTQKLVELSKNIDKRRYTHGR